MAKGYTLVPVRFKGGRTVKFKKRGSKETLCTPRKIKIKGKTFFARPGGRTLCGPSTGKNTAAAREARREFKRKYAGRKHRRVVRRRRTVRRKGRR